MKNRIVESMAAASRLLKVPVSAVQKAKRAGCPAFRPGNRVEVAELGRWLKAQGVKPKRAKALKVDPVPRGASHSLRRLEEAEAVAWERLQVCRSDFEREPLRKEWLQVSEQLRKHDAGIEVARRDAGELLPRAEVERVLRMAAHVWQVTINTSIPDLAYSIAPNDHHDVSTALRRTLRTLVLNGCAVASASYGLPEYAVKALSDGVAVEFAPDLEDFKERGEVMTEILGDNLIESTRAELKAIREKRERERRKTEAFLAQLNRK